MGQIIQYRSTFLVIFEKSCKCIKMCPQNLRYWDVVVVGLMCPFLQKAYCILGIKEKAYWLTLSGTLNSDLPNKHGNRQNPLLKCLVT